LGETETEVVGVGTGVADAFDGMFDDVGTSGSVEDAVVDVGLASCLGDGEDMRKASSRSVYGNPVSSRLIWMIPPGVFPI
jgi:hypothetical protein